MSKIRVKNFGPITGGLEGNGFIDIDQVTLFIGNQATGKSSAAKLYSTLTWLEKSLSRGDTKINDVEKNSRFVKTYCAYQGISGYFREGTEIEYRGKSFNFYYNNRKIKVEEELNYKGEYLPPKIMYVPAERNFLSVVENPEKIKYLPLPLYTFLDEFERSKRELNTTLSLPINNVRFEYQKQNKISYITGNGYKLKLHEASSGIQSLLPLFLVSRNLAYSIIKEEDKRVNTLSVEQRRRLLNSIERINSNKGLTEEIKSVLLEQLLAGFKNLCFINIVEEVGQNLFPTSQRQLLNKLLEYNNLAQGNKLLLTTHSPYILNYLTIAIKGYDLTHKINSVKSNDDELKRFEEIVPIPSCVPANKVNIYEFGDEGNIKRLEDKHGVPSDKNYLNKFLFQTNELFDELLELESELYG